MRTTVLVCLAGLWAAGCASVGLPEVKDTSPASPAGAEAPTPAPSETLRIAPPEEPVKPGAAPAASPSAPQGQEAQTPPSAAVSYTCPMHPEVVSKDPGKCPKCGMALVPKQPAAGGK